MDTLKNTIIVIVSIYLLICVLIFIFQRHFIYYPSQNIKPFEEYSLDGFQEVILRTNDGVDIVAWYKKPLSKTLPLIVMFHGNADNLSHRIGKIIAFTKNSGYGVVAIDYRGYGRSIGTPSEQGLYADARATMKFLDSQRITTSQIILYGESLGTAIAIKMAEEYGARMLVLEAPFVSATKVAQESFSFVPAGMLLLDKFNSVDIISSLKMPVLILYGSEDQVINPKHSKELYDKVFSEKRIIRYDKMGHNNLDPELIIQEVIDFYQKSK